MWKLATVDHQTKALRSYNRTPLFSEANLEHGSHSQQCFIVSSRELVLILYSEKVSVVLADLKYLNLIHFPCLSIISSHDYKHASKTLCVIPSVFESTLQYLGCLYVLQKWITCLLLLHFCTTREYTHSLYFFRPWNLKLIARQTCMLEDGRYPSFYISSL